MYTHQLMHTHTHTHIYIYIYKFKKFKMYIKTLKTLLHVSITLSSSSGSTYCSLLKLCIKTISDILRYINFGLFVCASYDTHTNTRHAATSVFSCCVIPTVYCSSYLLPVDAECCYSAAQWYPPQTLRTNLLSSLDHVRC